MEDLSHFNPEVQVQCLLSEAKGLLKKEGDFNESNKEDLYKILEQVDFLLGKHDDIYERFTDMFSSMANFDFSQRLSMYEDGDNFVNFVINGINILNEEFESEVLKRKVFIDFVESLELKNTLVVLTNTDGFIYLANSGSTGLNDFNDKSLTDQSINTLFFDFKIIEDFIKKEGSAKGIEIMFKWKNASIPAKVDVIISNSLGKIESVIYIIKLKTPLLMK